MYSLKPIAIKLIGVCQYGLEPFDVGVSSTPVCHMIFALKQDCSSDIDIGKTKVLNEPDAIGHILERTI